MVAGIQGECVFQQSAGKSLARPVVAVESCRGIIADELHIEQVGP